MENKATFVTALGELINKHTRLSVDHTEYVTDNYNREYVRITYNNGYTKDIDITADSNIAIMLDVAKTLCY
jgi:hypothetical protein